MNWLYRALRARNDVRAIEHGRYGKRAARRVLYRASNRAIRKLVR